MTNQTKTKEILNVLIGFKKAFIAIGVFSFFLNLLLLAPTFYMLQIYDRVVPSRNEITLLMISLLLILFYLYFAVLDFIRNKISIRISNLFDLNLSDKVYISMFKANLNQQGINASQFLGDLNTIRQFLNSSALFVIFDAPWFPINLLVIFLFNFKMGLFALLGACIVLVLAYMNERLSNTEFKKANEQSLRANNIAMNNLRNAEVIAAMGMLENLKTRWYKLQREYLIHLSSANEKIALINSITKFFRGIFQSLILGLGAYLTLSNEISPGMMIAGSILMGRVLSPLESLIGSWKYIDTTRSAYKRLNKLLEIFPQEEPKLQLPSPTGQIDVEQVFFSPEKSQKPILNNINLKISVGEIVGIIGPSGAGKSTLGRLLLGITPPTAGKIRLDSADINTWNRNELGPYLGYLPQEVSLFEGTVAENIARFGELDSEKIIQASKSVGIHDFILHLPNGYETMITNGGNNFSGGQKQRIGLARAIYNTPSLIILDEPNSNADEAAEIALRNLIIELKSKSSTVIIITHRTQILQLTTQLVLLNEGVIQIAGPTEQVINELVSKNADRNNSKISS